MYTGGPILSGDSLQIRLELASLPLSLPRRGKHVCPRKPRKPSSSRLLRERILHYLQAFPVPSNLLEREQPSESPRFWGVGGPDFRYQAIDCIVTKHERGRC